MNDELRTINGGRRARDEGRRTGGKLPISVYVLTFNNRRTIEQCLKSLDWAEELVVVDSGSTDGTYEVCQRYTDKLYRKEFQGHRDQYQYAADLTTREWVMFVDADEEVPLELVEEIGRMLKDSAEGVDGFFVYRRTYYLGKWIRYGGWYPDGEIRLYRRDKGRWEGGLHAKILVGGKVSVLKNKYLHYTYRDISDQIQTIDKYSRIAAEDMAQRGEKFSFFKLLFHPPFRFIKEYLLKSGFRDGLPGLIIIVSTMFYVFIKYAKLREISISEKEREDDSL
ncbi:MAG: glycosyltransferase family 2 protein [Deltaproteobacteria bacterium]|nr:glycosyltransferase family 2 protein [Deltaproteobacteria bacterium]